MTFKISKNRQCQWHSSDACCKWLLLCVTHHCCSSLTIIIVSLFRECCRRCRFQPYDCPLHILKTSLGTCDPISPRTVTNITHRAAALRSCRFRSSCRPGNSGRPSSRPGRGRRSPGWSCSWSAHWRATPPRFSAPVLTTPAATARCSVAAQTSLFSTLIALTLAQTRYSVLGPAESPLYSHERHRTAFTDDVFQLWLIYTVRYAHRPPVT